MRKFLSIAFLIIVAVTAEAQSGKGPSLSVGADFNIPLNTSSYNYGDLSNYINDGLSGAIRLEVPANKSVHLLLSAGFAWYANAQKDLIVPLVYTGGTPTTSADMFHTKPYEYIPLKGGLRYYFVQYFYVDGEAGAAIAANSNTLSSFIYSGTAGFIIPLTPKSGLDFSFGYARGYKIINYDSSMNQLSMGVAYKIAVD